MQLEPAVYIICFSLQEEVIKKIASSNESNVPT